MKSKVAIAILVLLAAAGPACLNDRDSVKALAARMPERVDILVDRFERNPPLYYQMRIGREIKELAANPNKLENYDDIGVAYDRLGNDDKAIEWMEKKLKILTAMGSAAPRMARYSYYANHGTFMAHRYFRNSEYDTPRVLTRACNEIMWAMEINPKAHAGREGMQLKILSYFASEPKEYSAESLQYFDFHHRDKYETGDNEAAILDIIRLGGGAESPDLFLLAGKYEFHEADALAYLRAKELIAQGHKGFFELPRIPDHMDAFYEADFKTLRDNAEEWQRNRTKFMLRRLKAGRHPDTDPHFWDGYVETPRAIIPDRFGQKAEHFWNRNGVVIGFFGFVLGGIALAVGVFVYRKRHPGRLAEVVLPKVVPQDQLTGDGGDIARF